MKPLEAWEWSVVCMWQLVKIENLAETHCKAKRTLEVRVRVLKNVTRPHIVDLPQAGCGLATNRLVRNTKDKLN